MLHEALAALHCMPCIVALAKKDMLKCSIAMSLPHMPMHAIYAEIVVLQIEDMLKRSFAEFHAQRAQPEALRALEEGQARLAALQV